jgi:hypothetical protein
MRRLLPESRFAAEFDVHFNDRLACLPCHFFATSLTPSIPSKFESYVQRIASYSRAVASITLFTIGIFNSRANFAA